MPRGFWHAKELRKPVRPLADRFWEKVDKSGDCWVWTASTSGKGYGCISGGGKGLRAHRVSWDLAYGPIPDGLDVLHKCDNPPCVRPDHLFLGTDSDNQRDCFAKGRMVRGTVTGEKHWHAKLTDAQVAEIRARCAANETQRSVAKVYGVHQSVVSRLVTLKRRVG